MRINKLLRKGDLNRNDIMRVVKDEVKKGVGNQKSPAELLFSLLRIDSGNAHSEEDLKTQSKGNKVNDFKCYDFKTGEMKEYNRNSFYVAMEAFEVLYEAIIKRDIEANSKKGDFDFQSLLNLLKLYLQKVLKELMVFSSKEQKAIDEIILRVEKCFFVGRLKKNFLSDKKKYTEMNVFDRLNQIEIISLSRLFKQIKFLLLNRRESYLSHDPNRGRIKYFQLVSPTVANLLDQVKLQPLPDNQKEKSLMTSVNVREASIAQEMSTAEAQFNQLQALSKPITQSNAQLDKFVNDRKSMARKLIDILLEKALLLMVDLPEALKVTKKLPRVGVIKNALPPKNYDVPMVSQSYQDIQSKNPRSITVCKAKEANHTNRLHSPSVEAELEDKPRDIKVVLPTLDHSNKSKSRNDFRITTKALSRNSTMIPNPNHPFVKNVGSEPKEENQQRDRKTNCVFLSFSEARIFPFQKMRNVKEDEKLQELLGNRKNKMMMPIMYRPTPAQKVIVI